MAKDLERRAVGLAARLPGQHAVAVGQDLAVAQADAQPALGARRRRAGGSGSTTLSAAVDGQVEREAVAGIAQDGQRLALGVAASRARPTAT